MFVVKRDGNVEPVDFGKIHRRINGMIEEPTLLGKVNGTELAQKVIEKLKDQMKTSDIDTYTANVASSLGINDLEYLTLAGRIVVNNHHKMTSNSFRDKIEMLYRRKDKFDRSAPLINERFYKYVMRNQKAIDKYIDYDRDYLLDFFGFKTLEKGYLLHIDDKIIERPQDLFMRAAIQLHMPTKSTLYKDKTFLAKVFKVYDEISHLIYTPATPTLFNSGMVYNSLSSCYLLGSEDSLKGIMKTLTDACKISKRCGGVGLHFDWRSKDSLIRGTNGNSGGVVPFLRMYNAGARAFNQGSKRNGSFAIYIEMHHADLLDFLSIKKAQGDENLRCRDLFTALWVPDLFMKRLESGEKWSLFDPAECPGLNSTYGEEYEKLYLEYESRGLARAQLDIHEIVELITEAQMEKGVPYVLFKDTVNRHSMQSNIGVIRSSNLCVAGDTQILTDKGYFPIKQLSESLPPIHQIWNGKEFTKATFAKTGEMQQLLDVQFSVGSFVKCTPYHKFLICRGGKEVEIEARDLVVDDAIIDYEYPNGGAYFPNPFIVKGPKISSITQAKPEDTYCFNEPKRHRGIFNGVILGNCAEIQLYSDANNYSSCNLSSICLSKFVEDSYSKEELQQEEKRELNHEFPLNPVFKYEKLVRASMQVAENLNNVIDRTYNPVVEIARANWQNRPIGIGIQGLADVFMKFRFPFESAEARKLNKNIAEAIYFGALTKSTELCRAYYEKLVKEFAASGGVDEKKPKKVEVVLYPSEIIKQYPELKKENTTLIFKSVKEIPKNIGAYPSYHKIGLNGEEAPIKTKFHWELYGLTKDDLSGKFDWETLRGHINTFGVRNSTVTAYMPTASTSQIMGNSSCFEPYLTNLYKRKTLAGPFVVINKYLMRDLSIAGLWNKQMKDYLLENDGSIQDLKGVPENIKQLYKTVWDIKQKTLIDYAADRQPFVDQSQSLNLFLKEYDSDICASLMLYGWKSGNKTGSYYIRSPPATEAQKFTIGVHNEAPVIENFNLPTVNAVELEEDEICLLCSS